MTYRDNSNKMVVVVNRAIPFSRLANAIAHCCAGLADAVGERAEFLDYPCPSGNWQARISRWPMVILEAKNTGQLARFVRESHEEELPLNCFTAAMIGDSAEAQIRQTREDASPEYWAAAAFGDAEKLRPLTKRFSLFKGGEAQ